jgi:hypothetical protein
MGVSGPGWLLSEVYGSFVVYILVKLYNTNIMFVIKVCFAIKSAQPIKKNPYG